MADPLLQADASKDNLIEQIQDLQERMDELERFALTSKNILASKIGIGDIDLDDIKDGDIATIPWSDYSATSTIVGWSSYTTKSIYYRKIGKLMLVQFHIAGTSDDTSTSFTLPYSQQSSVQNTIIQRGQDNGTWLDYCYSNFSGSAQVDLYASKTGGAWTASGTKSIVGQFWYKTS